MIFNKKVNIFYRAASALFPLFLFGGIVVIWAAYLFNLIFRVATEEVTIQNYTFRASSGTKAFFIILAIFLHLCLIPMLLSLWRVVTTPAGTVPKWYKIQHEGDRKFFAAQHGHPDVTLEMASSVAVTVGPEGGKSGHEDLEVEDYPLVSPEPGDTLTSFSNINVDALLNPGPHDVRYCKRCRSVKPPRAHHCGMCGECVLKMDHHCPWVANCVGFGNYKAFYLMVFWGLVILFFVVVSWLPILSGIWQPFQMVSAANVGDTLVAPPNGARNFDEQYLELANKALTFRGAGVFTIVGAIFALSFGAAMLLFCPMHTLLILKGQTTLEANLFGDASYNVGRRRNWEAVMGRNPWFWFWPAVDPGVVSALRDGTDFRAEW